MVVIGVGIQALHLVVVDVVMEVLQQLRAAMIAVLLVDAVMANSQVNLVVVVQQMTLVQMVVALGFLELACILGNVRQVIIEVVAVIMLADLVAGGLVAVVTPAPPPPHPIPPEVTPVHPLHPATLPQYVIHIIQIITITNYQVTAGLQHTIQQEQLIDQPIVYTMIVKM